MSKQAMGKQYRLYFYFDWRADTAFWSANDFTDSELGYRVDPAQLPLAFTTVKRVLDISQWHDDYLNLESPSDPSQWRQDECDRFNTAARELYEIVVRELGDEYEIVFAHDNLEEDPDLDEYLKDPQHFKRKS